MDQNRQKDVYVFYLDKKSFSDFSNGSTNEKFRKYCKEILETAITLNLTSIQRQYLTCYFYYGMKQCDIAEKFNVNKSTVSRTIKRAVRRLQNSCQ